MCRLDNKGRIEGGPEMMAAQEKRMMQNMADSLDEVSMQRKELLEA